MTDLLTIERRDTIELVGLNGPTSAMPSGTR